MHVADLRSKPLAPTPPVAPVSGWWLAGSVLVLTAMLIYLAAWFLGEPTARGLLIGPLMVLLVMPLILRLRRTETRFDLAGIVYTGLGLKLCANYGRLWMVDHLFGGVGDSIDYHDFGKRYAPSFRRLNFDVEVVGPLPGTGFLRVLTGVVYTIFGTDRFTGFIVFGMLSFLGSWFFYKAFSIAMPDGDHKRYAMLLFFWPSLVFWPAGTGKEAWMVFSLGLASAGAAAAYSRRSSGYVVMALGILAAAMPRPHIAIVVLAAVGVGLTMAVVFGAGAGGRKTSLLTKVIGMGFLFVAAGVLAPTVATFLQIEDVDSGGLENALSTTQLRTSQGGSGFTPPAIGNPLDYPWAILTVLFRPFPHEVRTAASAISALEGLALLALVGLSARRLIRLPVELMRNAYMSYAAAFTFLFVYVFSFIGNFGILARQRVQLLPFLLVLLALPAAARVTTQDAAVGSRTGVAPQRPVPKGVGVTISPPRSRS